MTKSKSSLFSRIFATVLSLVMVLSVIQFPSITAFAATTSHPDAITITVGDTEGNPIQGAIVDFLIDSVINGNGYKTGRETTDANGEIEVMPSADYVADDLTITATISKEHYKDDTKSIKGVAITSADQDFGVTLISTLIDDVTVTATSVAYDGENHPAATVSGIKTDDTVSYKLNEGEWQSTMPTINAPDAAYSLIVKVERTDYEPYETTVTPVVSYNTISLDVVEYAGNYDKASHPALTIAGLLPMDTVTYKLNGGQATTDVPNIINAGKYTIDVHVERYGYNDYDKTFTNVEILATTIDGLSAVAYTGTYDGQEHNAVNVSGAIDGDTITYQLNSGTWTDEVPTIKSVGNYTVKVKVTRTNYLETDVEVLPANAYISQEDQTLSFSNSQYMDGAEGTVTFDKSNATNNVYNFSAIATDTFDDDVNDNAIVYSIENATDDGMNIDDIATINSTTGEVTVKSAGIVTIKATRLGNDNYNKVEITYSLIITVPAGNLASFSETNHPYIIGQNDGIVSELVATKANIDDNGNLTYSIDETNIGLSINSATGKVTVTDFGKLAEAMSNNNGNESVEVTVNKSAGTKGKIIKREVYAADTATYTINISFFTTPSTPYALTPSEPNGTNDWYTTNVVASAADSTNYTISKTCDLSEFGTSVTYSDQGADNRYVYLRDTTNGGITARILLEGLKIDTAKPDYTKMDISYSKSITDTVLGVITLGFYKPSVTVTFTAEDATSGFDHFDWSYTKQSDASNINKATDGGELTDLSVNGTSATATVTLTASQAEQYRGNISFTSTDKAGNESEIVTDDENVLVVDTVSPTRNVVISSPKTTITDELTLDKTLYFDNDATITFNVDEANFFASDVKVTYIKDGGTPSAVSESSLNWTDNADVHTGALALSGDGDYKVYMTYTDRSTNEMESYESDLITIDTTIPVVDFSYDKSNQSTTFTVTEHNFRDEDISVLVEAKDITGADVTANDLEKALHDAQWTKNGDVYITTVYNYVDAIYNLTISYTDISTNKAVDKESSTFIIDHANPTGTKIEYSTSIIDTVLETLTLGFYNPSVTVTFTAYDTTAGVDYFTWNYTKQDGASSIKHPSSIADTKIDAVQDTSDKTKFTAKFVLTATEAEQYRGYIETVATDTYKNIGDKVTDDGNIIVVDTITPTMNVEYSESSRTVGTNMYYNNAATATFTVTEANFFKEDVKVTVSKNGGTPYSVTPSWVDTNVDVHVGTLVLPAPSNHSNDGHYVINVTYTDRSNNEMTSYTSDAITIDTINPTVNVVYSNANVKNKLEDGESNIRDYFDNTQNATITVTEHNFNAHEVSFDIVAKDVTGAVLENSNLISKSVWTDNGDKHTIVITYSGDANYTFDVQYTDLATNVMADYSKDYFTVDKTAPTNLTVSYSTSVLDTVLESITFGFYNAKMAITITADDATSKINNFDYSYIKATGVSDVNAELLKQTIAEAEITYSNGNSKATMTFEIPKMVLGNDNQFNGTVQFTAKDRSGNSTEKKDAERIVVDNIAPTSTVSYNEPVNSENGISYYAGNVSATINMTEANFYSADVSVMVSKDGGNATAVATNWKDTSAGLHTGTFTLSDDGNYIVSISYKDKSNNQMVIYTSNQLTIDTKIDAPTITINGSDGNGKAYKDNVIPAISFNDQNYDNYEVTLTQTRYGNKNADVKSKFIGTAIGITEKGGLGSFDTFKKLAENDGIYTLTVKVTDKAKHEVTTAVTFTVNRFGSVYEFNDTLNSLIADGGAYVKNVNGDLVVTEYNADKLVKDSVLIEITKDGKPLADVNYTATPTINDTVALGESGWYQYEYTIAKNNFASDGVYKMTISSKDKTGNTPENTNYENQVILFRVDSTPAEITSITGLEESIINAQEVTVKYDIYDTIGLASAVVYIDDKAVDTIEDFSNDQNNYSGSFKLSESSKAQSIKLVVTDLAGNVIDTSSGEFKSAYVFNSSVTVSTNAFVRWYANKLLFWGSIGGVVLLGAGIGIFVGLRKKKKAAK